MLFNCRAGQNRSATLAIAIVQRGGNTLLRHEAFGGAVDEASGRSQGESELEWWEAGMSENSVSSVNALQHVRLCVSRVAWRVKEQSTSNSTTVVSMSSSSSSSSSLAAVGSAQELVKIAYGASSQGGRVWMEGVHTGPLENRSSTSRGQRGVSDFTKAVGLGRMAMPAHSEGYWARILPIAELESTEAGAEEGMWRDRKLKSK